MYINFMVHCLSLYSELAATPLEASRATWGRRRKSRAHPILNLSFKRVKNIFFRTYKKRLLLYIIGLPLQDGIHHIHNVLFWCIFELHLANGLHDCPLKQPASFRQLTLWLHDLFPAWYWVAPDFGQGMPPTLTIYVTLQT